MPIGLLREVNQKEQQLSNYLVVQISGQLDDLMYFVKKLYKSLKVPATRLDANDPFKDGTEITREELRFARFIIRLQAQLAQGLKRSFINHLKLREKTDSTKSIWGAT